MKILDKVIKPGQSVEINMNIAKLYTRTNVDVPIIVKRAKKEGPCLLLVGGIHGDEINGVEIVRQVITRGLNKPERGTVICIPLLNVFGFLNQDRKFPDGRDLNRVFPGSKAGSLASRFAFHLMTEVIPHVDYCIDFHTGGASRFNVPHLRINGKDPESFHLAKVFGTSFVKFAPNRENTFRESMVKLGKKVLLFEGGQSLSLDEGVTKSGVQGVINVMHELGIRDFSSMISEWDKEHQPTIIRKSSWVRARYSGMYRPLVKLGQEVEKGTVLGTISDPFGDFEKSFKSPQKGYVLCSNLTALVNQGDALFHIGFEE